MKVDDHENGIYYFLGNTVSHVTHALPLYEKIGGTFVTLSKKATKSLYELYGIKSIYIGDVPYQWQRYGWKVKPIHEYDTLSERNDSVIKYLEDKARVVIFYDLFDFRGDRLRSPKKVFLTHGNMLKDYMGQNDRVRRLDEYDYMAAIGPYLKEKFIQKYHIDQSKLLDLGIARTDEIVRHTGSIAINETASQRLGLNIKRPVVSYLPTFWGASSIYTTGYEILRNIPETYTLIFRPHPQTPRKYLEKYISYIRESNKPIYYIPDGQYPDIRITDILNMSSVIIGDLSSVMLDAVLTKKPLIFTYNGNKESYPPEYKPIENIIKKSRILTMDDANNLGEIVNDSISNGIDETVWDDTIRKLYYHADGKSVDTIANFVTSQIT